MTHQQFDQFKQLGRRANNIGWIDHFSAFIANQLCLWMQWASTLFTLYIEQRYALRSEFVTYIHVCIIFRQRRSKFSSSPNNDVSCVGVLVLAIIFDSSVFFYVFLLCWNIVQYRLKLKFELFATNRLRIWFFFRHQRLCYRFLSWFVYYPLIYFDIGLCVNGPFHIRT